MYNYKIDIYKGQHIIFFNQKIENFGKTYLMIVYIVFSLNKQVFIVSFKIFSIEVLNFQIIQTIEKKLLCVSHDLISLNIIMIK